MITTAQALSKFSKELQEEYNELERIIDAKLEKFDGSPVCVECCPTLRVRLKIIKDYSAGGWSIKEFHLQDEDGLTFTLPVPQSVK